jgi:hypothetical protein
MLRSRPLKLNPVIPAQRESTSTTIDSRLRGNDDYGALHQKLARNSLYRDIC